MNRLILIAGSLTVVSSVVAADAPTQLQQKVLEAPAHKQVSANKFQEMNQKQQETNAVTQTSGQAEAFSLSGSVSKTINSSQNRINDAAEFSRFMLTDEQYEQITSKPESNAIHSPSSDD